MSDVDATIIRQGELIGRRMMAYETTEEMGVVDHLLVDVKQSHTVGLSYKAPGLLARKQSLSWSQLVKIGRDSLVVKTQEIESDSATATLAAAQNMTGLEVWTDGGDHIGKIVDLCLNADTGKVEQYLFALHYSPSDNLSSSEEGPDTSVSDDATNVDKPDDASDTPTPEAPTTVYVIEPSAIISAGRKRMMIAEEDAQRAQAYAQLLIVNPVQSVSQPRTDWKPERLPEIPTDFGELLQQGQSLAGKVTQQVRQRAKQFTDEQLSHQDWVEADSLPDITEQLQEKTEQVKHQMQEQLRKAQEKAREQAQHQLDSPLGKKVSERIENNPLGRSLGKAFDKFKRPTDQDRLDSIDVDAFEVWEDD